jgi:hypothetical protein
MYFICISRNLKKKIKIKMYFTNEIVFYSQDPHFLQREIQFLKMLNKKKQKK